MDYQKFLEQKSQRAGNFGFEPIAINKNLFDFQEHLVRWSLLKGRAAIFADCGLGKTLMQLCWADNVVRKTNKPVLILTPLAVAEQTKKEGDRFGINVKIVSDNDSVYDGINITNYEKLHRFDMSFFAGVVLDESSILKSYSGKYRNEIIDRTRHIMFKLACTATPAPNDFMELGNHSEFLGAMTRVEMLATYFIHDGKETQKWRLKGHAQKEYWKWVSTWACMIKKPSDLGYSDNDFTLPKLNIIEHVISTNNPPPGMLFAFEAQTLQERRNARKNSTHDRCELACKIIKNDKSGEQYLIWCNLNNEASTVTSLIDGAVEVSGSDTDDHKKNSLFSFADGSIKTLVTKPKIAGFGMNWQNCHNVIFLGLSDSYEQFYQAVRRCWRFGQKKQVNVHIILSDQEMSVLENINRKERDAENMAIEMVKNMSAITKNEIESLHVAKQHHYCENEIITEKYKIYNGDCIELIKRIEPDSIGYSIFSPPFADLYCYSDSDRDMGNSRNYEEFFNHFEFLISELFRVIKPGRLVSFHCIDIPSMKERDGVIGLKDFPGDLIRSFQRSGFIYHSKHIIWKDPLVEATRTKALGLMHKQIQKDSSMCRAGLPDYLITMRKPGDNSDPISHPHGFTEFIGENRPKEHGVKFSHITWQKYASPVWMDIRQTHTLNKTTAREHNDEKHICPLQLDVIERALALWSNPGDVVLSPFMGIGSEGYVALQNGRCFVGFELKKSYFDVAAKNIQSAATVKKNQLFDLLEMTGE